MEKKALQLANDTEYGLTAQCLDAKSLPRLWNIAIAYRQGTVWVNSHTLIDAAYRLVG